jgi:hypothetical protein
VQDGSVDFSIFINYDPNDSQRVYTVSGGSGLWINSQQNPGEACVGFSSQFRQGAAITPTSITGIVDRSNSLNPAFVAPYDVGALYAP